MANGIVIRQTNPPALANPHLVTNPVISPFSRPTGHLQQSSVTSSIRELLFEMRKDGEIFWVGAAVPIGVSDFTKVYVFFHPTPKNKGVVIADDRNYPTFTGGWSDTEKFHVPIVGGQLAKVRQTLLIVPFMTMASFSGSSSAYMFATRPLETLNAIISAVHKSVTGNSGSVSVAKIGVWSFSNGIGAMRLFIRSFGSTRLIVETTDLDGPFIHGSPKIITRSPGALGRVITQIAPPHPMPGWLWLPQWRFQFIVAFKKDGVHRQIGRMMFLSAGAQSAIR